MTLKGWEGKKHCAVNTGASRHNSLDAYNNDGNDDEDDDDDDEEEEEEAQNRFQNSFSLEFGEAQFQRSGINLLAPELLFFLILAHSVYKTWILQEPNTLELWNKLHLEEEKNWEYIPYLKHSVPIFVE